MPLKSLHILMPALLIMAILIYRSGVQTAAVFKPKAFTQNSKEHPFFSLIDKGDFKGAKAFIEKHKEVVNLEEDGRIPLFVVLQNFSFYWTGVSERARPGTGGTEEEGLELVKCLVAAGADINQREKRCGTTPLMFASRKSIVDFLISKGADITAKDYHNNSVLFWAAYMGNEALMRTLRPEVKYDEIELLYAIERGDMDSVKKNLTAGANVNCRFGCDETPLMRAVRSEKFSIAKFLVTQGADLDAKMADGRGIMFYVYERGYADLAEYFQKYGCVLEVGEKRKLDEKMDVLKTEDFRFDVFGKGYSVGMSVDYYAPKHVCKELIHTHFGPYDQGIHYMIIQCAQYCDEEEIQNPKMLESIAEEELRYCNEFLKLGKVSKVVIHDVKTSKKLIGNYPVKDDAAQKKEKSSKSIK